MARPDVATVAVRKYMTSHGPRILCDGPEAPTQWKSGSVTDYGMTDLLTRVTARDAYTSKIL